MPATLGKNSAFDVVEYKERLEKVRGHMERLGVKFFLVHTPENLFYLTGQDTPGYYAYQCSVITMDHDPVLLVRASVEDTAARHNSWMDDVRTYRDWEDPIQKTVDIINELGGAKARIGIEIDSWFFTSLRIDQLKSKLSNATFVAADGIVESCRLVKSPKEIEYMRMAAELVSKSIMVGVEATREGTTENKIIAEVHRFMALNGCDWTGLPTFISSGPRTSMGHAIWAGRRIEKGDIVHFEFPFAIRKYHAANMRDVSIGEPTDEQKKIAKIVVKALEAGLDHVKPGAKHMDAWQAAKKVIDDAGYGAGFGRRFGYSIGIAFPPDWGEGNIMSIGPRIWGKGLEQETFLPNMTFHVVPGINFPGKFALRFSDTIRVTESGCEVLTKVPRELFVR